MDRGRSYSAGLVDRLANASFSKRNELKAQRELAWVLQNQTLIVEDIRATEHLWVDKLPEFCKEITCACTGTYPRAPIFFSRSLCAARIHNRESAVQLILHETFHHFLGADERTADHYAAVTFDEWKSMGHPDFPHWIPVPFPPNSLMRSAVKYGGLVVTESSILSLGIASTDRFNLRTGKWDIVPGDSKQVPFLGWEDLNYGRFLWSSGYAVGPLGCDDTHQVPGVRFHEASGKWEPLPPFPGGNRNEPKFVKGVNNFLFFGGRQCADPQFKRQVDGAIYDVLKHSWEAIPILPELRGKFAYEVAFNGLDIFVFARDAASDKSPLRKLYRAHDRKWHDVNPNGAPVLQRDSFITWRGNEVLILGGLALNQHDDLPVAGGRYDTKREVWATTPKIPPSEGNLHWRRGLWIDDAFLVVDRNGAVTYSKNESRWEIFSAPSPNQKRYSTASGAGYAGLEVVVWDDSGINLFYP